MNMEIFNSAIALATAQAGTRPMTAEEICTLVQDLTKKMTAFVEQPEGAENAGEGVIQAVLDPKKSIKDRSVTCLVCGRSFKVLTAKHLMTHGFESADAYCEAFGLKKGTSLVCKALQKTRREKMREMRLWERRKGKK